MDRNITGKRDHLLHLLHAVQQQHRHIQHASIVDIARQCGLPIGQVESVVDFYSFFHRSPRGRYDLLFSNCTSCGDLSLMQALCTRLNCTPGKTHDDGVVSIAATSCIGMCDQGPALLLNGMPLTALDAERIEAIAQLIEAGKPVADWPEAWFAVGDNLQKPGLLLTSPFAAGSALRTAFEAGANAVLEAIGRSGLRGRGGAGFATALKWKFCREAASATRYVVCNADEGEPGTFKDRLLLASHADMVFEGMTLAGYVIGAKQGFLYLRGEYRYLLPQLEATLAERRQSGLLGKDISGHKDFSFDIDIVVGAGAYICGEESALIESLEEKRGVPRVRPPFPVTHGYLCQPTVVNNVETLAAAAAIAAHGADWFSSHGTEKSAGSKILSISGDCAVPGIYEYPFGITVRQILDDCKASDVQAVQVGGPSGTLIPPAEFDRRLGFEDLATGGSFMVFGSQRDLLAVVQNFARFFAHESCGFCTPCRVGTTVLRNLVDKFLAGHGTRADLDEMHRLALLVKKRSHCGLGQTAPNPLLDLMHKFPQLFEARLTGRDFEPGFNLDAALAEARRLTHRDDAEAHLS